MLIRSYGLFWRADEVDWTPGKGNKNMFRLLGRQGKLLPGLRLADFRHQVGIYILYGDYGPHYVGLTKERGFGQRLKEHLSDDHGGLWDRFSWFGFRAVLKQANDGVCVLKDLAGAAVGEPKDIITDMEALLIKAMGLSNKSDMAFSNADRWEHVKLHEAERYLEKKRR